MVDSRVAAVSLVAILLSLSACPGPQSRLPEQPGTKRGIDRTPAADASPPSRASGPLTGIDVSHYQGAVDWVEVRRSGVHFAFIKATQGTHEVDRRFRPNWTESRRAGLLRGAYHFFLPAESAEAQARHFLATVRMDEEALPPVLDVEKHAGLTRGRLARAVRRWLDVVEEGVGCRPIVYTGQRFWNEHVGAEMGDYPLWIAQYGGEPRLPVGWRAWTFWQHTDSGHSRGVETAADLDDFRSGDLEDLQALLCPGAPSDEPSSPGPAEVEGPREDTDASSADPGVRRRGERR